MKKIFTFLMAAVICFGTSYAALKRVAFVYQEGYNSSKAATYGLNEGGYTPDQDPIHNALAAEYDLTLYNSPSDTEVDYTELATYDCVVLSEAIPGNATVSNNLVKLVGTVPVVSMKTYNYTSGRWSWAAPSNPGTKCNTININAGFESHPIFAGLTPETDGSIALYDPAMAPSSNRMQGFATTGIIAGSPIEAETDKLLAVTTSDNLNTVHELTLVGKPYVLVGLSSDNIWAINDNGVKIIINAVNYVMGDGDIVMEEHEIAYIYDESATGYCGIDNDPVYNGTKIAEINTTAINIKDFTAADTDTLAALENFDAVVLCGALNPGHAFVKMLGTEVNRVPMLNFNAFLSQAWGFGTGVNPTANASEQGGIAQINVASGYLDDALFTDMIIEEGGAMVLYYNYDASVIKTNLVQGFTATDEQLFSKGEVLATVVNGDNTYNAVYRLGNKNTYVMLPMSFESIYIEEESNLSDDAIQLINNAVDVIISSKGSVTSCITPSCTLEYSNLSTQVTLSSVTEDAVIYYTLDGSEPTVESLRYQEPFTVTVDSTSIKAIAMKQGFNNSEVYSGIILVKAVAEAPVITLEAQEGKTVVSITCATEDATIYYNYTGSNVIAASATYTAPIEVRYPLTITAFAGGGDYIESGIVSKEIGVTGITKDNIRLDTLAQFDANTTDWYWETEGGSSKVAYYVGKSSRTSYASIDTIVEGNDTTYNYHFIDDIFIYAQNDSLNAKDNGWFIRTKGQVIQWENTSPLMEVGYAGAAAYYADAAEDMITTPTRNHITFGSKASGEPFTASIESSQKHQGPFDIITFTGNNNSDGANLVLVLETSLDANEWTTIDTLDISYYKRFWKRNVSHYEGSEQVYVRVKQVSGGTKAVVYDILLMNNGDVSQTYVALHGLQQDAEVIATEYYNLNGLRIAGPAYQGITIVRKIYSNGYIKVEKIFIK